jgi:acyl carrier protein
MTQADALQLVRESVAFICQTPIEGLASSTRPQDIKGWDSFGRLQVVLEIERRSARSLSLADAVSSRCIGELVTMLVGLTV